MLVAVSFLLAVTDSENVTVTQTTKRIGVIKLACRNRISMEHVEILDLI